MLVVPFSSDYDQRFTSQLGEEKYTLDARWNERGQVRALDITRDSDQVLLVAGVPLLAGQDVLAAYALGIGGLLVTDLGMKDTDPGPDDFGERVIVTWLSNDELAAMQSALRAAGRPSTLAPGVVPPILPGGRSTAVPTVSGGSTTIVNANTTVNNFTVTGGLGFSAAPELDDATGDEILIGRFLQMPGLNPNPTISIAVAVLARGNGTVRVYVGGIAEAIGSSGTPSGTAVGTPAAVVADDSYQIDDSLANPGGMTLVKVTMQSAAPATSVGVALIQGFLG